MNDAVYALVDCNAFYCSCERAFDPRLLHRPVVVLSNNDGCVVSRTQDAKDGGIPMGVPYYQVRPLLRKIGCVAKSSNYALYADMSARVQDVLRQFDFQMEVYSIDESFLRFDGIRDLSALAHEMKARVFEWTAIPVGVGIAPTKCLAKIANKLAKKRGGVCVLMGDDIDKELGAFPIPDMWGIGLHYARLLLSNGFRSALDLKNADDKWIQDNLTIVGLRIVNELRGVPCIELEEQPDTKKNLMCSRMFSRPILTLSKLEEALSTYCERVCQKLRKEKQLARVVHAFVQTNPFKNDPYVGAGAERLAVATANTSEILQHALRILRGIYRAGREYTKAGVLLLELSSNTIVQPDLFEPDHTERDARIMGTIDAINKAWGAETVTLASSGIHRDWAMKRDLLSPCYTTRWEDMATVTR